MSDDFDHRQHRYPESRYFEDLVIGERFYIPSRTVTDANLVLGYLPADLLGGEMKLDRKAAERADTGVVSARSANAARAPPGRRAVGPSCSARS